jgi:hypothetical protein
MIDNSLLIKEIWRLSAAAATAGQFGLWRISAIRALSAMSMSRWSPRAAACVTDNFLRWGAVSPGLTARSGGFVMVCQSSNRLRYVNS